MQLENTEVSAGKIGVINGLRGLAMIGVIVQHLFGDSVNQLQHQIALGPIPFFTTFLLTNGFQGVALFFLLSGFVLALPYLRGQRTMETVSDAMTFYRRRLRRLGPLYTLCVLISIIFVYPHGLLFGVFLMLSMTFSLSHEMFFPAYNLVLWSLAVEAMFSLILPLILVAIRRYSMYTVLLSSVVFSTVVRFFSAFVSWNHALANGIPGRLDDFIWGVFLAYLFVHRKNSHNAYALPLGLFILFMGAQIFDLSSALVRAQTPDHPLRTVLYPLVYSCTNIGWFLVADSVLRGRHRVITWLLEAKTLQMIGLMSYSIYVWHFIMIRPLSALMDGEHIVRYLGMVIALSAVTYRFVEFGTVTDFRTLLPSPRSVRFPLASRFRTRETSHIHSV